MTENRFRTDEWCVRKAPHLKRRTRARELALQFLYQLDVHGEEVMSELHSFIQTHEKDQDIRDFASQLVKGTRQKLSEIDQKIQSVAQNWLVSRMAVVDRNILRLASYEIIFIDNISPRISINEAIELAKNYGDADSGAFVNALLEQIALRYAPPYKRLLMRRGKNPEPTQ